ncbi:tetratricopeptide repeat-containing diguanylate cyclase [Echinimonas agarilytica]|uniref:GGDEF domain-containing protein n=1 Tax=Echinimonas agarilytica TaxID=1215918 RepID=A0AA41W825_9GAMM|nr:GGDEF domain-containing protein [Echinimonas agarilytica]MCM2680997.1 GGDEF domain-containing protein [Echinimonas agarilytica]
MKTLHEESNNTDIKTRSALTIANHYSLYRNYPEALQYLRLATSFLHKATDPELQYMNNYINGFLYLSVAIENIANEHIEQLTQVDVPSRWQCLGYQLRLKSISRAEHADLNEVSTLHSTAHQSCDDAQEPLVTFTIQQYYVKTLIKNGAWIYAKEQLLLTQPSDLPGNYPLLSATYYIHLAQTKAFEEHYTEAEDLILRGLDYLPEGSFNEIEATAYATLYDIANSQNDYQKAIKYYKQYSDANTANLNVQRNSILAFNMAQQHLDQKNQLIQNLSIENLKLSIENNLLNPNSWAFKLLMSIIFALFLCVVFYIVVMRARHQEKLRHSKYDILTGMAQRDLFETLADQAVQQCTKTNDELCVVVMDLDHFKQVNDQFGHATGDWVLSEVSKIIERTFRSTDIKGRLGGEEFVILMPHCRIFSAERIASNCLEALRALNTQRSGYEFDVTASIGITSNKISGAQVKMLIDDADKAMYQAKRDGRNRAQLFHAGIVHEADRNESNEAIPSSSS